MMIPPASLPQDIHFLLLPEFSMMGFVSAIEPLRVVNRFKPLAHRWHVLSVDGGPVTASNGMSINAEGGFKDVGDADAVRLVFVAAGFNPLAHFSPALASWLRAKQSQGVTLGGLDTGAFVLARAQLIGNQAVTLHWEAYSAFAEAYPRIKLTQELFEIGPRCITCAGGTAAIDMMLALIEKSHSHTLAAQVSEQFVLGRIRSASEQQRMDITARFDVHNAKTVQVIRSMETHIEDPLSTQDLANVAGVTTRQLERLFHTHLQTTPSHFYLNLRLDRARQLLRMSDLSVMAVTVACGFGSSSHFSRAYHLHFGRSPKNDRTARAAHKSTK